MDVRAHRSPLALLVGADSALRRETARRLTEQGIGVVLCSGPPGCMLEREDRCVLLSATDIAVLLPGRSAAREQLAACAKAARRVIVAGDLPGLGAVDDEAAEVAAHVVRALRVSA